MILIILNFKNFGLLKHGVVSQDQHAPNQPNSLIKQAQKRAADQAYVLFVICAVFLCCHGLRVTLGIHEFFALDTYKKHREANCNQVSFSVLVAGSISTLMLTLNSSVNFVIYALMSRDFRKILTKRLRHLLNRSSAADEPTNEIIMTESNMRKNTLVVQATAVRRLTEEEVFV